MDIDSSSASADADATFGGDGSDNQVHQYHLPRGQGSTQSDLEAIEQDIVSSLRAAGQAIKCLGTENASSDDFEQHAKVFFQTIRRVQENMSHQIEHLPVSQRLPHENSSYGPRLDLELALKRREIALLHLDRITQALSRAWDDD